MTKRMCRPGTMNNYTYAAEAIKSQVTMQDAIALYAPSPAPRHSRIPCPVHNGKDYNLSFTDALYHCFVCGSGGDVIHFVQHTFELDFMSAVDKLNTDFGLGIPLERPMTLRERNDAEKRHQRIIAARRQAEREKQEQDSLYWELWEAWIKLDKDRQAYAPKHPGDALHPLFVQAIQNINYVEYLIDTLP